jgi:anti-anti-sigma regulatory factor
MHETLTGAECQIVVEYAGAVRIVCVGGRLAWETSRSFRDRMRHEWTQGSLVIDLTHASASDSSGAGVVLAAAARAQRRGQPLIIVSLDPGLIAVLSSPSVRLTAPIVGCRAAALRLLHEPCHLLSRSRERDRVTEAEPP